MPSSPAVHRDARGRVPHLVGRAWGQGQTPAQRILGLRCWRPEAGHVADRGLMALRQFAGLALNGQLLIGVFILLSGMSEVSVGDVFAGTVVVRMSD